MQSIQPKMSTVACLFKLNKDNQSIAQGGKLVYDFKDYPFEKKLMRSVSTGLNN